MHTQDGTPPPQYTQSDNPIGTDVGGHFPLSGELPGVDAFVDTVAGADILTPVMFWALPGVALKFEPPPQRSATDVLRHLRSKGIGVGWLFPITPAESGAWLVKVPPGDSDRAEAILRRIQ